MFYSFILLINYAISGLEWTGTSFIGSVCWSSEF